MARTLLPVRFRLGAAVGASLLLVAVGAAPAAADEGDAAASLDAAAAAQGLTGDELLDAVPYVNGDPELGFEATRGGEGDDGLSKLRAEKAKKERVRAVAAEHEDDDGGEADDGDDAARPAKPAKEERIGAAFSVDPAQVIGLRDEGVGWGAIFKLHQIAYAKDVPVADLLAGIPQVDGEYEFDFGELRKSLTDEEQARMAEKPRNLGAANRPDHAGPKPKADRDAAKAEREAEREAAKAERESAEGAADNDEDDGDDRRKPKRDKPPKPDRGGDEDDGDEAEAEHDDDD